MGTIWLGAPYFLAAAHVHPIRFNGREWARSGRGLDDRAVAQHRRHRKSDGGHWHGHPGGEQSQS